MRKMTKRLISLLLAVLMISSLGFAALAESIDSGNGGAGTLDKVPSNQSKTVTFVPDIGYTLTPAEGTTARSDGSIVVGLGTGTKVPMDKVPGTAATDAYYRVKGWAIKDNEGKLVEIELEKHEFTEDALVYALCEDLWQPYKDMKQDRTDWFYRYVRDLSIGNVINGYPGYTFAPKGNVTWGEALKLIMLAVDYPEQARTGEHWASGYLTKAQADGLVDPAAEIDLKAYITRVEYARVASAALKLADKGMASPFVDTKDQAVLNLYDAGILEGSMVNGQRMFRPDDNINRAEISTVIWRINNYNKNK